VTAALDQPWLVLRDSNAKASELKLAAEQARKAAAALDLESDQAPEREARVLAGIAVTSIADTVLALRKLDDEMSDRALMRKVRIALADHLDERWRAIEAAEAAKDPAQRRREQETAAREAQLQALFARVPVLFRTDFMASQFGKAAYSRTPPPQGRQISYVRTFDVPRSIATPDVMASTRVPGWPPKYGDVTRIEWPNSDVDEDEKIVGPLRLLCQKSSVSEDEVTIAIARAQASLIREFAQVCTAIREHYPAGLPRSIALPSLGPRAMAAE
jgi:hypothetical protein